MIGKPPTLEPRLASQLLQTSPVNQLGLTVLMRQMQGYQALRSVSIPEACPNSRSTQRAQHAGRCTATSQQGAEGSSRLRSETRHAGQGKHWEPAPPALGQLQARCPLPESFLGFCHSFVFLREMPPVVGDRKGGETGRAEVHCSFIGTLVRVPFEKLPPGLPEPQERWDFPHVDRAAGLCPLGGRSGRANGKQGTGTSSPETDFLSAKGSGPANRKMGLYGGDAGIHSEQDSQGEAALTRWRG